MTFTLSASGSNVEEVRGEEAWRGGEAGGRGADDEGGRGSDGGGAVVEPASSTPPKAKNFINA